MANEIFTRIQLKYDSYANWTSNNPTLLAGEVAIAKLVSDVTIPTDADKNAPVLFKVGPGAFNSLPWVSGLAADVYGWAKKTEDEFKVWAKGLVPVEVIDNGTGKFVTDVTVTNDANGHHITITRADVYWGDIQNKPNLVNSVKTTDDDVVILTPETAASGDVTITGAHKKYNKAGTTTDTNGDATTAGSSVTIKVPTLAVDEYGHTSFNGETSHTITIPSEVAVGDGEITIAAGDGLTTGGSFNVNQDNDDTITIDHAIPTGATAGTEGGAAKFIKALITDKFGHITGAVDAGFIAESVEVQHEEEDITEVSVQIVDNADLDHYVSVSLKAKDGLRVTIPSGLGDILIDGSELKTYTNEEVKKEADRAKGIEGGLRTDVDAVIARVQAFLDNTGAATDAIDTLQELLTYIETHDDVEISGILADLQKILTILDGFGGESQPAKVKPYVDAVTEALNNFKTYVQHNVVHDVNIGEDCIDDHAEIVSGALAYSVDSFGIPGESGNKSTYLSVALKKGGVTTEAIADGAITEEKLEQDVQDALDLARTALQEHQSLDNYKTKRTEALADQNLSGATVIKGVAQDANGDITVTTRALTPADIGAATSAQGAKADTAVQKIEGASVAGLSRSVQIEAYDKDTATVELYADVVESGIKTKHIADSAVTTAKLQGARKSTGTDNTVDIVIFNCGTSTTVI